MDSPTSPPQPVALHGVCGDCLATKPVYLNPSGPVAVCAACRARRLEALLAAPPREP